MNFSKSAFSKSKRRLMPSTGSDGGYSPLSADHSSLSLQTLSSKEAFTLGSKWASLGFLLVKLICGTIIFFASIFTVFAVGPAIETRYLPAVSKLTITSIEETSDGRTRIRVAFRKLRDCEYIGITWFVGSRPDSFERVSVVLMRDQNDTSSPNRPIGYQTAGPWIIGVPPEDLKNHSFAQLVHRCHPFWPTVTDFFP
ncbi:hypothetical protein [Rhizobium leguminosarum]|uniref:hypothetical protein n=1 Tax=Rhizobium leguminosarum TaxID=384 RepID=UPI0013BDDB3F|nr:hypothetical protein [Rhizobium leguminosarum]NEH72253.1 hypothetical protein [Rhizobium leguminosarum]